MSPRIAAILALTACSRELALPPPLPPPPSATLSGHVMHEEPATGRLIPAAGARVELVGSGEAVAAAADGFFRFAQVPAPPRRLLVRYDSAGDGLFAEQRLVSDGAVDVLSGPADLGQIIVGATADLRGRVLLQGTEVASGLGGTTVFVPNAPYYTVTGDDGSFTLAHLPAGTLSVVVTRTGFTTQQLAALSLTGGAVLELHDVMLAKQTTAPAKGALSGRVLKPDFSAASGAVVALFTPANRDVPAAQVTTAAGGTFRFEGIDSGPYGVVATADGFGPALPGVLLVQPGENALADVILAAKNVPVPPPPALPPAGPPPLSVAGRIVYEEVGTGRRLPAAGARVELAGTGAALLAGADGTFDFAPAPPPPRRLVVRYDLFGDGTFARQRELDGGALDGPGAVGLGDIVVAANGELKGRILLGDKLPAETGHGGIAVFVPQSQFFTATADDGSFDLKALPPGTLTLAAAAPGYQPAQLSGIALTAGALVTLQDVLLVPASASASTATVTGRVLLPGATPAPGAQLVLAPFDQSAASTTATAGADGTFSIASVAPGTWRVRATLAGYGDAVLGAVQLAAGPQALGDLRLSPATVMAPPDPPLLPPPPPSVSGRVVAAEAGTGRLVPASGARLEFLGTGAAVLAAADGTFHFSAPPPAPRRLLARFDGDGDGVYEAERVLEGAALDASGAVDLGYVLVTSTGAVRGRVVLANHDPAAGGLAGIVVLAPGTPFFALTGDAGGYVLSGLPASTLAIAATRGGYHAGQLSGVTVAPGATTTLGDLVLQPLADLTATGTVSGRVLKPDRTVASGALVALSAPGASTPAFTATADAKGTFSISAVTPGAYLVRATAAGFGPSLPGAIAAPTGAFSLGDIVLTDESVPEPGLPQPGALVLPTAIAGDDLLVKRAQSVTLDGTRSTGAAPLSYQWTQRAGDPPVALNPNGSTFGAHPVFTAPDAKVTLRFTLVVTDANGLPSAPSSSNVVVDGPPVAVGTAQPATVGVGQNVQLIGHASSDPDSDSLTYKWEPLAGAAAPTSPSSADTVAKAPTTAGAVAYKLTVSDGLFSSSSQVTVSVVATNLAPVAAATGGKAEPGGTVTLDGSGTSDPDGDVVTYLWEPLDGGPAPAAPTQAVTTVVLPATPATFQYRLTVTDAGGLTSKAYCTAQGLYASPPRLTRQTPAAGATALDPSTNVIVEFDRGLDPQRFSTSWLTLVRKDTGAAVPATVTYADLPTGEHRLKLVPASALPAGTYTAAAPSLPDPYGLTTAALAPWDFSTRDAVWTRISPPAGKLDGTDAKDQFGSSGPQVAPTVVNGVVTVSSLEWPFGTACYDQSIGSGHGCLVRRSFNAASSVWSAPKASASAQSTFWGGPNLAAAQIGDSRYEAWMEGGDWSHGFNTYTVRVNPDGTESPTQMSFGGIMPALAGDGVGPFLLETAAFWDYTSWNANYSAPAWYASYVFSFGYGGNESGHTPLVSAPSSGQYVVPNAVGASSMTGGGGRLYAALPVSDQSTASSGSDTLNLLVYGRDPAGTWTELKGGVAANGILNTSGYYQYLYWAAPILDLNDTVYVAFLDGNQLNGALKIKVWQSGAWSDLAAPGGTGARPTSFAASGSRIYLAWETLVNSKYRAFISHWDGAAWTTDRMATADGAINDNDACDIGAYGPRLAAESGALYVFWSETCPDSANSRSVGLLEGAALR